MSVPYALYAANSAAGPQGPAGATGPQGPIGLTGAAGPQGPAGPQGATGPQGPAGNDGATGATGPAGPQGATGPQGPQGPIGLTGATGPQGPAGNDGATGPQGATGATGPAGPQGATGPTGIINVFSFNGYVGTGPFSSMGSTYNFVGPTATITITSSSQKVYGSACVPIATAAGSAPILIQFGLGYQPIAGGTILNFVGGNYAVVELTPTRTSQTAVGYISGLVPGTYKVGVVLANNTSTAISNNDYVNGWVMVTN